MAPLPETIIIGGATWKIKERTSSELWEESRKDLLGQCVHSAHELHIMVDSSPEVKAKVLLHEIIHALAHDIAVDLTEREVRQLTHGLFALIRSNRPVFDHICDPEVSQLKAIIENAKENQDAGKTE